RIRDNTISGKLAKQVCEAMANRAGTADAITESKGAKQVADTGALEAVSDDIIAKNAGQREQCRPSDDHTRKKRIGLFVRQGMEASQGKANPQQVNDVLKRKLEG